MDYALIGGHTDVIRQLRHSGVKASLPDGWETRYGVAEQLVRIRTALGLRLDAVEADTRTPEELFDEVIEYDDDGMWVKIELDRAIVLLRQAADSGHVGAMYALGRVYKADELGVQDYTKAARWFHLAALHGSAKAMREIGRMQYFGMGTEPNEAEAFRWARRAAEAGELRAMNEVGFLYRQGIGVQQDLLKSFAWYYRSAEHENVWAMYRVGEAYAAGNGVNMDRSEAVAWMRLSVEGGVIDAMLALGRLYSEGVRANGLSQNEAVQALETVFTDGSDDQRQQARRLLDSM